MAREWFSERVRSAERSSRERTGPPGSEHVTSVGNVFTHREMLGQQGRWGHQETKGYKETKERR